MAGAIGVLGGATFLYGYSTGNDKGREQERQAILENLDMRIYDLGQEARLSILTAQEQSDIIEEANKFNLVLRYLEPDYHQKKLEAKK